METGSVFNPSNPEYKRVEDLPEKQQKKFVDVPEGGFVRREAFDPILEARIEEIIKKDPHALERKITQLHEEALEFGFDREKLLKELKRDGWALQYASEDLRDDKGVVLEAVKQDGEALQFASEDLRDDKGVVLEAVKQIGWALQYASEDLSADREFVLEVVKQNWRAFQYASKNLLSDLNFLLEIAKVNPKALVFAPRNIRKRLGIE